MELQKFLAQSVSQLSKGSMEIEVLEALPGNGKSHSTLRYIEAAAIADSEVRWIYCTEYLSEIESRTAENPAAAGLWHTPSEGEKTSKFLELLKEPKVQLIAITHALLLSVSRNYEVNRWLKDRGFNLFMDECMELIKPYDGCTDGNFRVAAIEGWFTTKDPYGKVCWTNDDVASITDTAFNRLANDAKRGVVFCATGEIDFSKWISVVQIEDEVLFTQFKRVVVATYQIEHTIFDAYLTMKGISRVPCTDIVCGRSVTKASIKNLLTIYRKHDKKFDKKNLSSTWWSKEATAEDVKLVNNAIRNIGDLNGCKGNAHLLGFTVPGNRIGAARNAKTVYPKGYPHTVCYVETDEDGKTTSTGVVDKATSTYVPCNARASNAYANKTVMVHVYNRYPMKKVSDFLNMHKIAYSSDVFALNEMAQWCWRSAIRNGEKITVTVLSKRMRGLLEKWLDTDK